VSETDATYSDLALPSGSRDVVGVYIDGVALESSAYAVLSDRIRLATPLKRRTATSGLGKLMLSLGVGVYNRGEVVDLEVRHGDRTVTVRGVPLS
jgi:hypothetical protein